MSHFETLNGRDVDFTGHQSIVDEADATADTPIARHRRNVAAIAHQRAAVFARDRSTMVIEVGDDFGEPSKLEGWQTYSSHR